VRRPNSVGDVPTHSPATKAALVSTAVIIATSAVFVGVAVVAPRLAGGPPAQLSPEELRTGEIGGSPIAVPRLRTGLDEPGVSADPVATDRLTPDPTDAATALPASDDPTPATAAPPRLVALMTVDKRTAQAGDRVTYEVTVTNTGGRTYRGAFTVNTHTPRGTVRCDESNVCVTPGDYDGTSSDPNDPHVNPQSVTRTVSVGPGKSALLITVEVVVASLSGSVLHNHAHIDGTGRGDSSDTVEPGGVEVSGIDLTDHASAPDVLVVD
jgi:uncharacterized repeat protein (TIGR01451 family)